MVLTSAYAPAEPLNLSLDHWTSVLALLEERLSTASFQTWVQPLVPVGLSSELVVLQAHSGFARDWLLKHFKGPLLQALCTVLQCQTPPELCINLAQARPQKIDQLSLLPEAPPKAQPTEPLEQTTTAQAKKLSLKTFSQWVPVPENQLAMAAAQAVAQQPFEQYNPLYIHGPVGSGKSHLLQAITAQVKAEHPNLVVRTMSAEQFTQQLMASLSSKNTRAFKERFRQVDVLILDDLSFVANKTYTQEELFHTFNHLYEQGKQIIVAADRAPAQIEGLDERLKSRFGWGLVVGLKPLTPSGRAQFLQAKAQPVFTELSMPPEVGQQLLHGLAHNAELSNARLLEGALTHLKAMRHLLPTLPWPALLEQHLNSEPPVEKLSACTEPTLLLNKIAQVCQVSLDQIKGPGRQPQLALARHIAAYVLRKNTAAGVSQIGQWLGGRSHATVLHSLKKIEQLLVSDAGAALTLKLSGLLTH